MQKAGERHGHAQIFSGRKSETNIFVAEGCGECGRLEFPISDQPAIGFVDRDVEQRRGQEVEILPAVEAPCPAIGGLVKKQARNAFMSGYHG